MKLQWFEIILAVPYILHSPPYGCSTHLVASLLQVMLFQVSCSAGCWRNWLILPHWALLVCQPPAETSITVVREGIGDTQDILGSLTLYRLYFQQNHEHVFTIPIIPSHWHDTGCWNPFSCKTRIYLFYKSISWVLMSWRRTEPGHQQPWYWSS